MNTLENIVYTVTDLDAAKAIHIALLGVQPHTDQPYYVGFNVAGIEIGFTPAQTDSSLSTIAHVKVDDLGAALDELRTAGATVISEPRDVGAGTQVAVVCDAGGTAYGLISHAATN